MFVEEELIRVNVDENVAGMTSATSPSDATGYSTSSLDLGCVYLHQRKPTDVSTNESEALVGAKTKERTERTEIQGDENGDYEADEEADDEHTSDANCNLGEPDLKINAGEQKWKRVFLENISGTDLLLRARSGLDLNLAWEQQSSSATAAINSNTSGDNLVKAGEKATLLVSLPFPTKKNLLGQSWLSPTTSNLIIQRILNTLEQGQRVDVLGSFLLILLQLRSLLPYFLQATFLSSERCEARTPSAVKLFPSRRTMLFQWHVFSLRMV